MRTSRFILAVAFLFGIMMQSYAQSNIHKIWIMSTQTPGLEMLFDLTDNTKMIKAHRYTQKALDKMGLKRIEPGVWYIKDIKNPENEALAAKIPVMCVNKRIDIIKLGGFN